MRTDHVTSWLIREWMRENAPELADQWDLEVDEQILPFAAKIETIVPNVRRIFTCQNMLARIAIEFWDLQDVALLAGGALSPFSPRIDQVLYYTDGNPEVTEEARMAGYNARHINVIDSESIAQLDGATTAIATGLFHFLPDDVSSRVFESLDQQGFKTIIFSHNTPSTSRDAMRQYENLGVHMFTRDLAALQVLLPPGWQIDYHASIVDFVSNYGGAIGAKLADTPRVVDFYKATKRG